MKRQHRKQYPMDGPNLACQRLMQNPRQNRRAIRKSLKATGVTRIETLEILDLR